MNHELKTWPDFFEAMAQGVKSFEYRRNDRGFRVGDTLTLREWDYQTAHYTGRSLWVEVTFIVNGGSVGIPEGYCIMQTKPLIPSETGK